MASLIKIARKIVEEAEENTTCYQISKQDCLELKFAVEIWDSADILPKAAPISDAEQVWQEDKVDGFLDSELPHP